MKKLLYITATFLILIYMITNPLDAVAASKNGLLLWFNTIIPTLLPFMILSSLIVSLDGMKYLTFWFAPVFGRLLYISRNGCYAVITGFLCGYPMGAKTTADLVRNGRISPAEGNYLLTFCNNVSPMFIISYVITSTLQAPHLMTRTLLILYASPVLCAFLLQPFYRRSLKRTSFQAPAVPEQKKQPPVNFRLIDRCIMDGFEAVVKLGGYIILFSILTQMAAELHITSLTAVIITGSIELTNGVRLLADSGYGAALTYILILSAVSFGGLSSIAQTESMLKDSGLSIRLYIPAKLMNAALTAFLTILSIRMLPL